MTKNRSKTHILIGLLFLFAVSYAQETTNTQNLRQLIEQIETKFAIKFSYSDAKIANKKGQLSLENISLQDAIRYLRSHFGFRVVKLSQRYYTIQSGDKDLFCAFLIDTTNNKPVYGASIRIVGTEQGRVSKRDGSFSFSQTDAKQQLRIKHLGYKPRIISIADHQSDTCTKVYLEPRIFELTEVVVLDYLTKGIQQNKLGFIQLKPNSFGILPGLSEPDVLQTIQALPGIKSIDETVSDINIRGGTNDQNLVLWNGIKMYQTGHFFGLISAFSPYLTDKVTVYKNGTPSQYTDGVSGTIAIKTKDTISKQSYIGGGFNLLAGDMFAQFPITDQLNIQIAARRSYTDIWRSPTYKTFFNKAFQDTKISTVNNSQSNDQLVNEERFYFYDLNAKILWDIDTNHKIRMSAIRFGNELEYTEKLTQNNEVLNTNSTLHQNQLGLGAHLKSKWSETFQTKMEMYFSYFQLDAENRSPFTDLILYQDNEVLETALSITGKWKPKEQLQFEMGVYGVETGITNYTDINTPPYRSKVKDVIRATAISGATHFKAFNNRLSGHIGFRTNYYINLDSFKNDTSFKKWYFEPRLSVNYRFYGGLAVQAKAEMKSQLANQVIDLEQNFLGVEKRRWTLADENDLPITTSKQAALGILYNRKGWYTSLEGFYKKVNGITTANQGFINEHQFDKWYKGDYTVNGLEFLINKKANLWSSWISYAYNQNTYFFRELDPKEFPNNLQITHQLTAGNSFTYSKFKLGLGLLWRSGKAFTQPQKEAPINFRTIPNEINYQPTNSSTLPSYFRLDASLNYEFYIGKLKSNLGASILNILNDKQVLNIYYRLDENNNEVEKIERLSLGITPNFSFRIQL